MEWIVDLLIWVGLVMLIVIEFVFGIDNLVFIVIFVEKLLLGQCDCVCIIGLILVMIMCLLLLVLILWLVILIKLFFSVQVLSFSVCDLIMLFGGFFLFFKVIMEFNEWLEGKDSVNFIQCKGVKFWVVVV